MILPRAGLRASHESEKACVLHEHRLFDFMLVWSCRIFCPPIRPGKLRLCRLSPGGVFTPGGRVFREPSGASAPAL